MDKRVVTSILAGVAFIVLMVGQFVPTTSDSEDFGTADQSWGGWTMPGQNFEVTWKFGMWGATTEAGGDSDYTSWYDGEVDASEDGVAALRTAPIFLTLGLAAILAGTILLWIPATTRVATWVFVGAGISMVVAAITHTIGIVQAYDGETIGWFVGAFMLWIGAAVAAGMAITPGVQKIVELNQAPA